MVKHVPPFFPPKTYRYLKPSGGRKSLCKKIYYHNEVSLADTFVKLTHEFMDSNNINLLEPSGQFGPGDIGFQYF